MSKITNRKSALSKTFAIALCMSASGAALAADGANPGSSSPQTSLYDQLYPYYAQFCGVTQIKPLDGKNGGGIGGHGVLYLKGACRDTTSDYPRLKLCDEGSIDLSNPESGTSITVDQIFTNANWTALDGKALLLTGGLSDDTRLTDSVQEAVIQRVLSERLFKGIKYHSENMAGKPAQMSEEEYAVRQSIGTDFAISFGRNIYCSKLPITREILKPMVNYLNSLNEKYHRDNNYNWSGPSDNCTHTTHNAIAAAGVYRPYGTDEFALFQAFNLAIPGNEYIDQELLGNDADINDVVAYYRDPYKRRMLLEQDWMVTQPGVLTENVQIHQNNALYNTDSSFLIIDWPLIRAKHRAFRDINKESRYSDIRTNLLYFQKKYRDALQAKEPLDEVRMFKDPKNRRGLFPVELQTEEFARFYEAYYKHIEHALAKVESQLLMLDSKK